MEKSNAAREREEAQKALASGSLKDRETYTAKQVAMRCGTDAKTMRKFFRSSHSTIEPVGQGGRYEFDAKDFPQIKREFDGWQAKIQARAAQRTSSNTVHIHEVMDQVKEQIISSAPPADYEELWEEGTPYDEREPNEEDLEEIEALALGED